MLYWAQNNMALQSGAWWEIWPPAIAIMLPGAALVMINFALEAILQNALHPYTRALGNSFPPLTGPRTRMEGIPGTPPYVRFLPQAAALPRDVRTPSTSAGLMILPCVTIPRTGARPHVTC